MLGHIKSALAGTGTNFGAELRVGDIVDITGASPNIAITVTADNAATGEELQEHKY